jgi:hypothetical protein
MSERITISGISDALSYAAMAQQVEFTDATVAVYFDQLHRCEALEVVRAVKRWVSTYDDPYRRLPTVGELRAIIRQNKSQTASNVQSALRIASEVKAARKKGLSPETIDKLIDDLESIEFSPPSRQRITGPPE